MTAIIKDGRQVELLTGENFSCAHTGKMVELKDFKLKHPAVPREARGKLLIKDLIGLTGMQVSLNQLPAGVSVPFYHQHKQNEELYIFIKGKGQMQVDGEIFNVEEGSVVRIATKGKRTWRNTGSEDLFYLVIQAKENSLSQDTFDDGIASPDVVCW